MSGRAGNLARGGDSRLIAENRAIMGRTPRLACTSIPAELLILEEDAR